MDKFSTPKDFTDRFPAYVYRNGFGATVQWRQAALDMANDRAKLIQALRDAKKFCPVNEQYQIDVLLGELHGS